MMESLDRVLAHYEVVPEVVPVVAHVERHVAVDRASPEIPQTPRVAVVTGRSVRRVPGVDLTAERRASLGPLELAQLPNAADGIVKFSTA